MADALAALLRTLNIGPCHVVGYSLGARVALRLAATAQGVSDLVRTSHVIITST
jgi:pimeloyl-ACP methyl ester carboxylesterase